MGELAEAAVQMARLLGSVELRSQSADAVRRAASLHLDQLAGALTAEAAASDDVHDRESALAYLEDRLDFLAPLLEPSDRLELARKAARLVAAW